MPIILGAFTSISDQMRDALSAAANAVINAGAGAPHLIVQTAGGAVNLIDFTLDTTSAFVVGATGVIALDVNPAITQAAGNSGAPARWVVTDADGNVEGTGVASGDAVVAGLVYAVGNFTLTTPVA
jgi:hypothetical protein